MTRFGVADMGRLSHRAGSSLRQHLKMRLGPSLDSILTSHEPSQLRLFLGRVVAAQAGEANFTEFTISFIQIQNFEDEEVKFFPYVHPPRKKLAIDLI